MQVTKSHEIGEMVALTVILSTVFKITYLEQEGCHYITDMQQEEKITIQVGSKQVCVIVQIILITSLSVSIMLPCSTCENNLKLGCDTAHCFLNLQLLLIFNKSYYLISLEGIHFFSQS